MKKRILESRKYTHVDNLTLTGWLTVLLALLYLNYLMQNGRVIDRDSERIYFYTDAEIQMQHGSQLEHFD